MSIPNGLLIQASFTAVGIDLRCAMICAGYSLRSVSVSRFAASGTHCHGAEALVYLRSEMAERERSEG